LRHDAKARKRRARIADHVGGRPQGLRHQHLERTARARRHTARYIVEKLAGTTNEALKSREVIEPLQKQDMLGGTPQEFADYVRSEIAKWTRVAAAAGMKQ